MTCEDQGYGLHRPETIGADPMLRQPHKCNCRMRSNKYPLNAIVHAHGTPGTGRVVFIEARQCTYFYTVEYHLPNGVIKHKTVAESDVILIDNGEVQP